MTKAISLCLVVVGLINIAPLLGVLSAQRLESAYAIELMGNDLVILMRHRALLFGILGGFILFAAFNPAYQAAAMIMAGISMVGFAVIVLQVGGYNASVAKVLAVDVVGIVFLAIAVVMSYLARSS